MYYLQPLSKAAESHQNLVYSREVALSDVEDTPTADLTNQTQGSMVVQQGRGDYHHHGNRSASLHSIDQTEKGHNICNKIIGQICSQSNIEVQCTNPSNATMTFDLPLSSHDRQQHS